jgi:hypothetical protein
MTTIFHKKIICTQCNGFFKRRKNRSKYTWICSRRENGYTDCKRVQIDEQMLIETINKRYFIRQYTEISEQDIKNKVMRIEVEDKLLFKIWLTDFADDPIVYSRNKIVY